MRLLFILFLFFISHQKNLKSEEWAYQGEIQDLIHKVAMAKSRGKLIWIVEDGQLVKKGDLIAKVDDKNESDKIEVYIKKIENLRKELSEKEAEYPQKEKDLEVALNQSSLELDLAKVEYEISKRGVFGINRSRFESKIFKAKIDVNEKIEINSKANKLYDKGLEQKSKIIKSKLDLILSENLLKIEEINLRIDQEKIKKIEEEKKLLYDLKLIKFSQSKNNMENTLRELKTSIRNLKLRIVNEENLLVQTQKKKEEKLIKSNVDAKAIHRIRWGKKVKVGNRVKRGYGVINLMHVFTKRIVIEIEENRITKVLLGQKVKVKIKKTGKIIMGVIDQISSMPHDINHNLGPIGRKKGGVSGISVFDVLININTKAQSVETGLKVEVILEPNGV